MAIKFVWGSTRGTLLCLLLAHLCCLLAKTAEDASKESVAWDDECAAPEDGACALVALQRRSWPRGRLLVARDTKVPAARAWISQRGLDYLSKEILPEFISSLKHLHFDESQGTYSGVEYRLWDVHVNSSNVHKSSLHFQADEGIRICLNSITAEVSTRWHAGWGWLSDSGRAEVFVSDGFVCGLVELTVSATGHPGVAVSGIHVELQLESVKFKHSSLKWLYNAAAYVFQKSLQEMATKAIKEGISDVASGELSTQLSALNMTVPLPLRGTNISLGVDLSLLALAVHKDDLEADVRGAIFQSSEPGILYPFPPQPSVTAVPAQLSESMVGLTITKQMFESCIWFLHRDGLLSYTVQPKEVPPNDWGLRLDTASLAFMVPGLSKAYPENHDATLTLELDSEPPLLAFETGSVELGVPMLFTFQALTASGSEFAFALHALVNATAFVWVEGGRPQLLRSNVTIQSASRLQQGRSAVGPVNLDLAQQLLEVVKLPAQLALNTGALAGGISLGTSGNGFTLLDTSVELRESGAYVFSDVSFILSAGIKLMRHLAGP